jgi:hypothetical protein
VLGLIQTATVYTENPTTGIFDVVAKTGLPCRLAHIDRQPAATAPDRAEFAAMRNMLWEPGYVLPETAQVDVEGVRWNPVAGTFGAMKGPSGAVTYRRCDVRRAL